MKIIHRFAASLVLIVLAGCQTQEVRVANSQSKLPVCCSSLAELPFETLEKDTRVNINEKTPLYSFDEGRSFFKAYSLGKNRQNIKIHSYYSVKSLTTHLFKPVVTFLDKNHVKTRTAFLTLKQSEYGIEENYISSEVVKELGEKYMIIHTDEESYGDAFYHLYKNHKEIRSKECGDPAVGIAISVTTGVPINTGCGHTGKDIPFGVIGEIRIQVQ